MTKENKPTSGALCVGGSNMASSAITVSGNSVLHVFGANGEYLRHDSEPYTITLYREK